MNSLSPRASLSSHKRFAAEQLAAKLEDLTVGLWKGSSGATTGSSNVMDLKRTATLLLQHSRYLVMAFPLHYIT